MKNTLLSIFASLLCAVSALGQSSALTINTTTGLVNIPGGSAVPNFAALKVGTVTITPVSYGTGVATFLATPTSANLAAAVTNETGSGVLVFGTAPVFTTSVQVNGTLTATGVMSVGGNIDAVHTITGAGPAGVLTIRNTGTIYNPHGGDSTIGFEEATYDGNAIVGALGFGNDATDGAGWGHEMFMTAIARTGFSTALTGMTFGQSASVNSGYNHHRIVLEDSNALTGHIKFYAVTGTPRPATAILDLSGVEVDRTARFNGSVGINIAPDTTKDLIVSGSVQFNGLLGLGTTAVMSGAGEHGAGVLVNWGAGGNNGLIVTNTDTNASGKVSQWSGLGYNNALGTIARAYTHGSANLFYLYMSGGDVDRLYLYGDNGGSQALLMSLEGAVFVWNSNLYVGTAGYGLAITEGTNCKQGVATLVGGTATVSTTAIGANSRIFLTSNVDGGVPGWVRVSAKTNGTSFVITSSSIADTSDVAWIITEKFTP